jgi:hypothetical protein
LLLCSWFGSCYFSLLFPQLFSRLDATSKNTDYRILPTTAITEFATSLLNKWQKTDPRSMLDQLRTFSTVLQLSSAADRTEMLKSFLRRLFAEKHHQETALQIIRELVMTGFDWKLSSVMSMAELFRLQVDEGVSHNFWFEPQLVQGVAEPLLSYPKNLSQNDAIKKLSNVNLDIQERKNAFTIKAIPWWDRHRSAVGDAADSMDAVIQSPHNGRSESHWILDGSSNDRAEPGANGDWNCTIHDAIDDSAERFEFLLGQQRSDGATVSDEQQSAAGASKTLSFEEPFVLDCNELFDYQVNESFAIISISHKTNLIVVEDSPLVWHLESLQPPNQKTQQLQQQQQSVPLPSSSSPQHHRSHSPEASRVIATYSNCQQLWLDLNRRSPPGTVLTFRSLLMKRLSSRDWCALKIERREIELRPELNSERRQLGHFFFFDFLLARDLLLSQMPDSVRDFLFFLSWCVLTEFYRNHKDDPLWRPCTAAEMKRFDRVRRFKDDNEADRRTCFAVARYMIDFAPDVFPALSTRPLLLVWLRKLPNQLRQEVERIAVKFDELVFNILKDLDDREDADPEEVIRERCADFPSDFDVLGQSGDQFWRSLHRHLLLTIGHQNFLRSIVSHDYSAYSPALSKLLNADAQSFAENLAKKTTGFPGSYNEDDENVDTDIADVHEQPPDDTFAEVPPAQAAEPMRFDDEAAKQRRTFFAFDGLKDEMEDAPPSVEPIFAPRIFSFFDFSSSSSSQLKQAPIKWSGCSEELGEFSWSAVRSPLLSVFRNVDTQMSALLMPRQTFAGSESRVVLTLVHKAVFASVKNDDITKFQNWLFFVIRSPLNPTQKDWILRLCQQHVGQPPPGFASDNNNNNDVNNAVVQMIIYSLGQSCPEIEHRQHEQSIRSRLLGWKPEREREEYCRRKSDMYGVYFCRSGLFRTMRDRSVPLVTLDLRAATASKTQSLDDLYLQVRN